MSSAEFGGMAANDGPVPVRTLAYAAWLLRDARVPSLRDHREPARAAVRPAPRTRAGGGGGRGARTRRSGSGSIPRRDGHEKVGAVRSSTPARSSRSADSGSRPSGSSCAPAAFRGASPFLAPSSPARTATPGPDRVPASLLIVGAETGVQVASIFHEFGTRVQLFEAGPRILPAEDEDVSAAVAAELRGIGGRGRRAIRRHHAFEKTPDGVRMNVHESGQALRAEAAWPWWPPVGWPIPPA